MGKKTYMVTGEVTISMHTMVTAESPEQAIERAQARPNISLCHQCAGSDDEYREWCTSGEIDGEPNKVEAREMKKESK